MDPDVRNEVLSRIDRREGRTPLFLYIIGLLLIVVAIIGVTGADVLPSFVSQLTWLFLGILFIYVGALIQERQRLGNAFRELLESFEGFNQALYGKDYRVQRKAIDILIRSLDSDNPTVQEKVYRQLRRITGEDLPMETAAWERWWGENRATFSRPGGGE